jgi:hypothetical protein
MAYNLALEESVVREPIHQKNTKNTFPYQTVEKPLMAVKFPVSSKLLGQKSAKNAKLWILKVAF